MTKESIKSIIEWNEQSFPDTTLDGQIAKFFDEEQELLEAKTEEDILSEMADCFIVASGIGRFDIVYAARFMGRAFNLFTQDPRLTIDKVQDAINKKMSVNRLRKWERKGNNYQHKEQ